MDLQTLTSFFMWCTLINGGVLLLWTLALWLMPGWVYQTQRPFFPLSQDTHQAVMYGFIGFYKILIIVFNLVPYLALLFLSRA